MKYYVYEWYDVKTNKVFYVGKGHGDRYKVLNRRSIKFKEYYTSHECDVRIIKNGMSEEDALDLELKTICKYREESDSILVNKTNGGDGFLSKNMTDELKQHLREINTGKNNPNYGNKWSSLQRDSARERALKFNYNGENNPNYGNKWNDDQKSKLSNIRKGNPLYIGENHGMSKKWIVLETGDIAICKSKIMEVISSYPNGKNFHFIEFEESLLDEEERFKKLLTILSEKCFIRNDKKVFYSQKELLKELPFGVKILKKQLKETSKISNNEYTYYRVKNCPFI
ncbi:MAG: NUMOD3 domain-containing DNA-binding protein [Sarcina sp.]